MQPGLRHVYCRTYILFVDRYKGGNPWAGVRLIRWLFAKRGSLESGSTQHKHLRAVSFTTALYKTTEKSIVAHFISPAVLKVTDRDQYGGIPKSSTLNNLISMIHHWSQATDIIILIDYRKAFGLID